MSGKNDFLLIYLSGVQPKMKPSTEVSMFDKLTPYLGIGLGVGVPYLLFKMAWQAAMLKGH